MISIFFMTFVQTISCQVPFLCSSPLEKSNIQHQSNQVDTFIYTFTFPTKTSKNRQNVCKKWLFYIFSKSFWTFVLCFLNSFSCKTEFEQEHRRVITEVYVCESEYMHLSTDVCACVCVGGGGGCICVCMHLAFD